MLCYNILDKVLVLCVEADLIKKREMFMVVFLLTIDNDNL